MTPKLMRYGVLWVLLIAGIFTALGAQEAEPTPEEENPCILSDNSAVDAAYFMGRGDAFFSQGNYTVAVSAYSCAIELDPNSAAAFVKRGFVYATQRNDELALNDYTRALELAPESVGAYTNRGVLYTGQGSFAPALADFDLALALDPTYPVALYNRAVVHAIEGNYTLALVDLEAALALDPAFAEVHAALGAVYLAMALDQYDQYRQVAGAVANPPGGDPGFMLSKLRDGEQTETFAAWLELQIPAR